MKPTIEFRAKQNSPSRASDGGGVQFPLVDRYQVRNEVRILPKAEVIAEVLCPDGAGGSDSRERQATDYAALRQKLSAALPPSEAKQLMAFLDRLDRQRKAKAAQMRRYRTRKA